MAFDYSSRDYETIRQALLERASRVLPEWTERDSSDFGMLLVDLWALMGDTMHYYIDKVAGEAFLPTATQRESVLAIANLLEYRPRSRSSAFSTLTLQNSSDEDVTIPAMTPMVAKDEQELTVQLYTEIDYTLSAASTTNIIVREGIIYDDEILTSASQGTMSQTYVLANDKVDVSTLSVRVYEDDTNFTTYQLVPKLSSYQPTDAVFSASLAADGFTTVKFGNGFSGKIPPPGSRITATYATSIGAAGNIPANRIIGFRGSPPVGVSIVSSTSFSGGLDDESVSSIKANVPGIVASQNRAVTRSDFVSLASQIPGVSKASMVFAPGSSGANASVTVYPQGPVSDFLTSELTTWDVPERIQEEVVDTIQPRALLGVNVYCAPSITWTPVNISLDVHVNDRFVSNWVKSDVETALDELFEFDNVFFGQRISLGQVYRIVLGVRGVDYCVITKFDTGAGTAVQDSILINELHLPRKGEIIPVMYGGITVS